MIPTIEWMRDNFARFNRDYFDDRLSQPRLALSKSRTRLGSMSCKRTSVACHSRTTGHTIRLSTAYDLAERQWQNVLLHEMIHHDIACSSLQDTAPHGLIFRRMMDKLNRRYGWEITVATRIPSLQPLVSTPNRPRLVLAVETTDNARYLSVVNPAYAQHLDLLLKRSRPRLRHAWYRSEDPYFSTFPVVRSLRGKRIDADLYHHIIRELTPISLTAVHP